MASEIVSKLVRSMAVCQPGLKSRLPDIGATSARARSSSIAGSALAFLPLGERCRLGLHHRLKILLNSERVVTVLVPGKGLLCPLGGGPDLISGIKLGLSSQRVLCGMLSCSLAKTRRSERELPPRRFAPWRPAPHSPAAKRPGQLTSGFRHRRARRHDVVAGRADFHHSVVISTPPAP